MLNTPRMVGLSVERVLGLTFLYLLAGQRRPHRPENKSNISVVVAMFQVAGGMVKDSR
jgi:hypothetical protein